MMSAFDMPFEPKRVLAGVDLSSHSAVALHLASLVSESYGASLSIVHALLPDAHSASMSTQVSLPANDRNLAQAENKLIVFIRRVIGRKPMPAYHILEAAPARAIMFARGYEHADLIVLGTRGRSGLSRLALGSVAEEVLSLAEVPVLTISARKGARRPVGPIRRILCPVNYTTAAGLAIETATSLARHLHADVIALHVIEQKSFDGDTVAEMERLRVWTRGLVPKPRKVETVVITGNGAAKILQYADDHSIDLIVVGARRKPGVDRTIFGSTTNRVTRHARCAVMTVIDVPGSR